MESRDSFVTEELCHCAGLFSMLLDTEDVERFNRLGHLSSNTSTPLMAFGLSSSLASGSKFGEKSKSRTKDKLQQNQGSQFDCSSHFSRLH